MRYSFEFKLECVKLYRQGRWPDTPKGVKTASFHQKICDWARIAELNGIDALKHSQQMVWTPEMKYELVVKVLAGDSYRNVAFEIGISDGLLYNCVCKYKQFGYNGLAN